VIGNAVHVMRIGTGEIADEIPTPESEGKDPAAVALGRRGGKARAEGLSKKRCARKLLKKRLVPGGKTIDPYRTNRSRNP
jgi:hypothetical protein